MIRLYYDTMVHLCHPSRVGEVGIIRFQYNSFGQIRKNLGKTRQNIVRYSSVVVRCEISASTIVRQEAERNRTAEQESVGEGQYVRRGSIKLEHGSRMASRLCIADVILNQNPFIYYAKSNKYELHGTTHSSIDSQCGQGSKY
jgi:hypothetical protein